MDILFMVYFDKTSNGLEEVPDPKQTLQIHYGLLYAAMVAGQDQYLLDNKTPVMLIS